MDLYDNKKSITPNEVNKFCYCPYQWFYERAYGRKELKRLAEERNERLGIEDKRLSNFNYGMKYHKKSRFIKVVLRRIIIAIILCIIIFVLMRLLKVG